MPELTTSATGSTSSSLIGRVAAHDPEAWQRLAKLYAPLVYRWARVAGLQESDAADIVQEVFRSVSQSIQSYDTSRASGFRAWLWGVARNKLREHFRRRASSPQAIGGTDAHAQFAQVPELELSSEDASGCDPEAELLHRALSYIRVEFEDSTWQAFWRATVAGESTEDIASALGISRQAVRQAKYRVLRRLRQELE
jgi:RNA polymerase sigma-70 factor (ECF subfamily)